MAKPRVILVHGMGSSTSASFKKEFEDACVAAFKLYPKHAKKKATDFVDIVSVGYNNFFEARREAMSEKSKTLFQRLNAIGSAGGDLTEISAQIAEFESRIADDEFFYTHFLDVILYRFTMVGEQVRISVAKEIAKAVADVGGENVHVVAHSLGTSVAHDAIAKLYSSGYSPSSKVTHLRVGESSLGSLHMVANTSRILQSFVDVRDSLVKPGEGGSLLMYREYRHSLDPFTWPKSFNPTENGNWISHDDMAFGLYDLVRVNALTSQEGNTHSLGHYLLNPAVHRQLFSRVFNFRFDADDVGAGDATYRSKTLGNIANSLQDALEGLRFRDQKQVFALYEAYLALKVFVEQMGSSYDFH